MKAKTLVGFTLAIVLAFGLFGFGSAYAASPDEGTDDAAVALTTAASSAAKPAKPTKVQLKAFKKASADFSLELFQRCVAAEGKNANVTIAPMSVLTALDHRKRRQRQHGEADACSARRWGHDHPDQQEPAVV